MRPALPPLCSSNARLRKNSSGMCQQSSTCWHFLAALALAATLLRDTDSIQQKKRRMLFFFFFFFFMQALSQPEYGLSVVEATEAEDLRDSKQMWTKTANTHAVLFIQNIFSI